MGARATRPHGRPPGHPGQPHRCRRPHHPREGGGLDPPGDRPGRRGGRAHPQRSGPSPGTRRRCLACVEGWSASARWRGVRLADVVALAGGDERRPVRVHSMQRRSVYSSSIVATDLVADRDTLLALEVNGEPLAPDHGAPCRLIAPNRPGVLQTKWIERVEVI
ncbi:MAG: molybdopterin-dependent oxidoreductase [Acidimicrobiales bacterium]